eukprot:PhM_4_TR15113/c0_g1_i1/m.78941/K14844/PUF6; pumilio homology domain family member 6
MGRTNAEKERRRDDRLESMPTSERSLKMAKIKRKEGRILNADERHAVKMHGELGGLFALLQKVRNPETPEERVESIDSMLKTMNQSWEKHCRAPQTSRMVQSCIKNGTPEHLAKIISYCNPIMVTLCNDPFSFHILVCFIRHATAALFADLLTQQLIPIANMIVQTKPGLGVLNAALASEYCNATKRNELVASCLGPLDELKKIPNFPNLLAMPVADIKESLKDLTDRVIEKQKLDYEIVHTIAHHALLAIDRDESTNSDDAAWTKELFDTLRPALKPASIVTTSMSGAVIAARIFVFLPPKEKKTMLTELADDVTKMASDKHGAPFLSAVLDHNQDTQGSFRFVLSHWCEQLDELLDSVAYRHFGKLLLRLCAVESKKKEFCVPEYWRRAFPMLSDDAAVQRHRRLMAHFLPVLMPKLEAFGVEDIEKKFSNAKLLFTELEALAQTEECRQALAPSEAFRTAVLDKLKPKRSTTTTTAAATAAKTPEKRPREEETKSATKATTPKAAGTPKSAQKSPKTPTTATKSPTASNTTPTTSAKKKKLQK